jgi:hypothetical protein
MILVDGDRADDWRFWVITPKTSPATRRIPVLLISADAGVRGDALAAGADVALSPDDLSASLPRHLARLARVQDPADKAQLAAQCQEPLPPLARQGVEKFNAGEYYAQHDLFEEQWVAEEGPVRDLYRAILQVGVAYFQITRGNYRGALKMLLRSLQWLLLLPDECQGVDVRQLCEDAARVREALESMITDDDHFDLSLLKSIRLNELN